jgi:tetratricopeptide (TPR) repeat protein
MIAAASFLACIAAGTLRVSVCTPATPNDLPKDLPQMLRSVDRQTVHPLEAIIAVSHLGDRAEQCESIQKSLRAHVPDAAFEIIVLCSAELLSAGLARNRAAASAAGDIISFIDADDIMFRERIEAIAALFTKFRPRMIVHDFKSTIVEPALGAWQQARLTHGEGLYDLAESIPPENQLHLSLNIMHAHLSVNAAVMQTVKFPIENTRTEDSLYVRQTLLEFGRHNSTALWLHFPLSWYLPTKAKKEQMGDLESSLHFDKGAELNAAGRYSEAMQSYELSMQLDPNMNFRTLSNLGSTIQAQAQQRHQQDITHASGDPAITTQVQQQFSDRLEVAMQHYTRAIELKPEHANAHANLGVALHTLKRLEEAAASYKTAALLEPTHTNAWFNLGAAVLSLGDIAAARASFEKTTLLQPSHQQAQQLLDKIIQHQQKQKQQQAARREL